MTGETNKIYVKEYTLTYIYSRSACGTHRKKCFIAHLLCDKVCFAVRTARGEGGVPGNCINEPAPSHSQKQLERDGLTINYEL